MGPSAPARCSPSTPGVPPALAEARQPAEPWSRQYRSQGAALYAFKQEQSGCSWNSWWSHRQRRGDGRAGRPARLVRPSPLAERGRERTTLLGQYGLASRKEAQHPLTGMLGQAPRARSVGATEGPLRLRRCMERLYIVGHGRPGARNRAASNVWCQPRLRRQPVSCRRRGHSRLRANWPRSVLPNCVGSRGPARLGRARPGPARSLRLPGRGSLECSRVPALESFCLRRTRLVILGVSAIRARPRPAHVRVVWICFQCSQAPQLVIGCLSGPARWLRGWARILPPWSALVAILARPLGMVRGRARCKAKEFPLLPHTAQAGTRGTHKYLPSVAHDAPEGRLHDTLELTCSGLPSAFSLIVRYVTGPAAG